MSTYTIVSGDSLWKISQDHGVTLDALRAANPQITNPDLIYPGQELNIPGPDQPPPESRSIPGDVPGQAPPPPPSAPPVHLAVCPPGPPVVPSAAAAAAGAPPAIPPRPPMARPPPPWINAGRPGYKTVGYFTNWGVYGRNYQPQDIPAEYITHILYSFANIRPTGEVFLTDTYSDLEKHYPTDSWSEPGTNAYGCIKQLYLLKQQHRHLKTLLSIGGWTYSPNFAAPASTPRGRETFARSAVHLLADLGFDGIDIDWEYPADASQAKDFVHLLRDVRRVLDEYSATHLGGKRLLLTIAAPCGPDNIQKLRIGDMDPYLDFWNLMCYDFSGSWDKCSGHMANVFHSGRGEITPFCADGAVTMYLRGGVRDARKLIFGLPLYGRAFEGTDGPGSGFQGVGEGSWENGVWDYKDLPLQGSQEVVDGRLMASWCFDPAKRKMVSYDTPEVAGMKTEYIAGRRLGGAMWWELSGDHHVSHERSLVKGTAERLGRLGGLDGTENTLYYPLSRFENLRRGCV
ncbi:glycoside hydrolase superfamily [Aspergillus welwitschiae]|uniref:chitinase n=1 Tax=Aspergillus welwitschiae TaxID=1341132 RepID=A0A3F3QK84_9EURO|nr:glycoside hydrolase superfamily [Aspergillus welwitschiae]RDH39693.1 glycoside hydrolase superfamily [Aspergillus welwitschiae]